MDPVPQLLALSCIADLFISDQIEYADSVMVKPKEPHEYRHCHSTTMLLWLLYVKRNQTKHKTPMPPWALICTIEWLCVGANTSQGRYSTLPPIVLPGCDSYTGPCPNASQQARQTIWKVMPYLPCTPLNRFDEFSVFCFFLFNHPQGTMT